MAPIGGVSQPTAPRRPPARSGGAPADAQSSSFSADFANFTYLVTHRPQGVAPLLRMAKGVISKVNTLGSSTKQATKLDTMLKHPVVSKIMSHFPSGMGEKVKALGQDIADSKAVKTVAALTEKPGYVRASGFLLKAAPVLGLALAPFDIKNTIDVCKDKNVSFIHKALRVATTTTGTLMCLGAVAGFVLPALGAPEAGKLALSVTGKIGLVNLAVSLPSYFALIDTGFEKAGRAMQRLGHIL